MQDVIESAFPPEIEEIIFSLASENDRKTTFKLLFVSKRVYEWYRYDRYLVDLISKDALHRVKPQLYRMAILHDKGPIDGGLPRFDSTMLKDLGKHVHHILFWIDTTGETCLNEPTICLPWCPNVKNVAFWRAGMVYNNLLIDQLLGLHLTHISFDLDLFCEQVKQHSISRHISFRSVTHLFFIGGQTSSDTSKFREYFPSITHMALDGGQSTRIEDIFNCWRDRLEVFVLFTHTPTIAETIENMNDPRLVVLGLVRDYVKDWKDTAQDNPDSFWRRAEAVIKQRGETSNHQ